MKVVKLIMLYIRSLKLKIEAERHVKNIEKNPVTFEQIKKSSDILKRDDILKEKINNLK